MSIKIKRANIGWVHKEEFAVVKCSNGQILIETLQQSR